MEPVTLLELSDILQECLQDAEMQDVPVYLGDSPLEEMMVNLSTVQDKDTEEYIPAVVIE